MVTRLSSGGELLKCIHEEQTEDEQFAEIEAAREAEGVALIAVPTELAPEVRALLTRNSAPGQASASGGS